MSACQRNEWFWLHHPHSEDLIPLLFPLNLPSSLPLNQVNYEKGQATVTLFVRFWHPGRYWRCVVKGGDLSELKLKKLVDIEFASSRWLHLFLLVHCYICRKGTSVQDLSLWLQANVPNSVIFTAWPSIFITCYNSGFGIDPAILI